MNIKTIGIDLAKSVFQVDAVDEHGKNVVQGKHVLGQIDSKADNVHAHLLPKDSVMRFCNPIRALRTGAGEGYFPHAASPAGDGSCSR